MGMMLARGYLAVVAGFAIFLCIALTWILGWPEPRIHDEFSYLLAGDTLLQGRLAHPTHAHWEHFESMHVISQPAYASKYPIGQGVFLAIGRMFGKPIFGVWISLACACAAITWMLRVWVGMFWGLTGGLLATFHLTTASYPYETIPQFGYWSQSYWGGAVAAMGGALMFGNARRIVLRQRWSNWIGMFLGLMIMAHSRPYEGLVVSLPMLAWIGIRACHRLKFLSPVEINVQIFGMATLATCVLISVGLVNVGVTGNLLQLPYMSYEQNYSQTPMFLFQSLRDPPEYRNQEMIAFHEQWERHEFLKQQSMEGYSAEKTRRLTHLWKFFLGPIFTFPFIYFLFRIRSNWDAMAIGSIVWLLAMHTFTTWMHPHYMAPATCLVFYAIAKGLRGICRWKWLQRSHDLVAMLVIILTCILAVDSLLHFRDRHAGMASNRQNVGLRGWQYERSQLLDRLSSQEGKHLVIVSYSASHNCHEEWVYNAADIDAAKVVWARDLGNEKNQELIRYYLDRHVHVWLAEERRMRSELEVSEGTSK